MLGKETQWYSFKSQQMLHLINNLHKLQLQMQVLLEKYYINNKMYAKQGIFSCKYKSNNKKSNIKQYKIQLQLKKSKKLRIKESKTKLS